jgi:hypothetical protein
VPDGPIDPAQSRLAQRRLLAALQRHLKRSPLRADLRVDTLVSELRSAEPTRPSGHRGQRPISLSDAQLRDVVDGMVAAGTLHRSGHRVRLPDEAVTLDPVMRQRLAELLAVLTEAGPTPPAAEAVARRLGIPPALVDQLRATGELVSVGPRIDYPRAVWLDISRRMDRLASEGPESIRGVRDELGTSRRHAEAILRHWNRTRSEEPGGGT